MSSEQTEKSNLGNNQIPNAWMPASAVKKRKSSEPMSGEMEAEFQKMLQESFLDENSPKPKVSGDNESNIATGDAVQQEERNDAEYSLQTQIPKPTVSTEAKEPSIPAAVPKRNTYRQRKESLEKYRQTFLTVPKLEDRKPVFISCEVRDRIDGIVHRLGGRGRSVSGFIENLAKHHLNMYEDDIEAWRKL